MDHRPRQTIKIEALERAGTKNLHRGLMPGFSDNLKAFDVDRDIELSIRRGPGSDIYRRQLCTVPCRSNRFLPEAL